MALTPTESKALNHYLEGSNLQLMLNNRPGYVNFRDKDTGEESSRSLVGLVNAYKEHKKEQTRQNAADKKQEEAQKRRYA